MLDNSRGSLLPRRIKKSSESQWAVSYSDFLMVLLSFFIIFFSTKPKTTLFKISQDLKKIATGGPASTLREPSSFEAAQSGIQMPQEAQPGVIPVLQTLSQSLQDMSISIREKDQRLEIRLKDNLYKLGGYQVPKKMLGAIIDMIKPHQARLILTIVGHTDGIKFRKKNNRLVHENFTLSSLRASLAAAHLKTELPQIEIRAQGVGPSGRNTRSLSLLLEER